VDLELVEMAAIITRPEDLEQQIREAAVVAAVPRHFQALAVLVL
jgi:hypothetical protein